MHRFEVIGNPSLLTLYLVFGFLFVRSKCCWYNILLTVSLWITVAHHHQQQKRGDDTNCYSLETKGIVETKK